MLLFLVCLFVFFCYDCKIMYSAKGGKGVIPCALPQVVVVVVKVVDDASYMIHVVVVIAVAADDDDQFY